MALDVQRDTFMLLPHFRYQPDERIRLGTILARCDGRKTRPNPDMPLNASTTVPIAKENINEDVETDVHFDGSNGKSTHGGIFADIPILSAISLDLGFGKDKGRELTIDCERVEVYTFEPDDKYRIQALQNSAMVKQITAKSWRPSVFLVTGLQIVSAGHKATITQGRNLMRETDASLSADLSAVGVAGKAGPEYHAQKSESFGNVRTKEGPFILSYQLERLRLKSDGSLKYAKAFGDFALMDDASKSEEPLGSFGEFWDQDVVTLSSLAKLEDEYDSLDDGSDDEDHVAQ